MHRPSLSPSPVDNVRIRTLNTVNFQGKMRMELYGESVYPGDMSDIPSLASRRYPTVLSEYLGKYPGDALWAAMVYFGCGAVRPRDGTLAVAALAFATSCVVEVLKLYQASWIVGVRHTNLGHLIFGHAFSARNLAAYAVGVVLALGVEVLWPYSSDRTGHASSAAS